MPEQPPPSQPVNVLPLLGFSVSTTLAPSGIAATAVEQLAAHLIPFGFEETEPDPPS